MQQKTGKKLLSFLLALTMAIGLMPWMSLAVKAEPAGEGISELPVEAGTYYLTEDITIQSTWTAPVGTTILDLNGHGIKMTGRYNVISVGHGATFTLNDSNPNAIHRFTVSNHLALVDDSLTGNYKTFTGGYITGGYASVYAGASALSVMSGGKATMNGGTLIGNENSQHGGAAYIADDKKEGGSSLTIHNGSIQYNKCYYAGAAIFVRGYGTLNIDGGVISDNYSDQHNIGGVNTDATAKLYMSGSPTFSNNGIDISLDKIPVNITGKFTPKKPVIVTKHRTQPKGVFTSNWPAYMPDADPADSFAPYIEDYIVGISVDGEVLFGSPVTVEFDNNGHGSAPAAQTVADGSRLSEPAAPTEAGWIFGGWYKEETCETAWDFSADAVSDSTTLHAKWVAAATAPTVSVTGADLTFGYTAGSVSVSATAATDTDYNLTYQWYSNTTNSNSGGTEITGATDASYTIPTGKAADTTEYYYCVVTAVRTDNSQAATTTSDVAVVTIGKASSTVSTDPAAKTVTYNKQAQELVTAGAAEGGTMKYAVTTVDQEPSADAYIFDNTSLPSQTDAGTYYVWYKAAGDENHLDSEPACISVDIRKADLALSLRIDNWETGLEASTPVLEGNSGNGMVTYTYAVRGSTEYSAVVPTDAGDYTLKASIEETDNYKAAETTCDFAVVKHQHVFSNGPRWLWRFIDGKAYAEATYSCGCGETKTVAADVKSADNGSTVTYTATDKNGKTNSRDFIKTFTVTYNNESKDYAYGATCRLTAEEASDWTVKTQADASGVVRAESTKTFYFPVTESVTVEAKKSTEAQEQTAKIDVLSYKGGQNQFTYKVFWSLPEGAQVKSTMIYRCRDDKAYISEAGELLQASNLRSYNMKLNVRNGQFNYTAAGLTSGSKQTVMAQVVYSLNGETCIIHTDPVSIAIE